MNQQGRVCPYRMSFQARRAEMDGWGLRAYQPRGLYEWAGMSHLGRKAMDYVSKLKREGSFIKFVNQTERFVDVMCLNFQGKQVQYHTLAPGQVLEVSTYNGHSWIAQDSTSGDRLKVQHSDVFRAQARTCTARSPIVPLQVNITLPVFSLQERCIQVICQKLGPGSAEALPLPPLSSGWSVRLSRTSSPGKLRCYHPRRGPSQETDDFYGAFEDTD